MRLFSAAAQMRAIPRSSDFANGGVSFWFREPGLPERRPALAGNADYDVCLVGAGFTGLWAAYYLKRAQPDLRVAVVEREFAGFGASGRNGGWLSAEFTGPREHHARSRGKAAVVGLQRALMNTVDEVLQVTEDEGIDADTVRGGMRLVATNAAQRQRLTEEIEYLQEWGYWPDDLYLLAPDHEPRLTVHGATAAAYCPHAARLQPAKLVTGLAQVVETSGVHVFEDTAVAEIHPRRGAARPAAVADHGTVYADHIILATEGFTATVHGQSSPWMPMQSSMIATEPLAAELWEKIGWQGHEVLADTAHSHIYAQRTADDRIVIGGRVAPQRRSAAEEGEGSTQPQTIADLWRSLTHLFPDAADVPIEHAWSGVLGVPRDGSPTVDLDTESGLGSAGGYAGSGVATSNLAGRTLRDLVLRRETELTRLPWVGHRSSGREPEHLHRVGSRVSHGLYRAADRRESASSRANGQTSRFADLATRISGLYHR